MAVVKRSVTLEEEVAAGIEAAVGDRGFSGWLNDAAQAKLDRDNIRALLSELDAEFGPVPPEELEVARRRWAELVAEPAASQGQPVDLLAALEASVRDAGAGSPRRRATKRPPRAAG